MTDSPEFDRPSVLSHGEREIAAALRAGRSVETIAADRDDTPEAVEKAVDRIQEKTDRALATLFQSPFADRAIDDLDGPARDRLATLVREKRDPSGSP